jgi:hypothetical protein
MLPRSDSRSDKCSVRMTTIRKMEEIYGQKGRVDLAAKPIPCNEAAMISSLSMERPVWPPG